MSVNGDALAQDIYDAIIAYVATLTEDQKKNWPASQRLSLQKAWQNAIIDFLADSGNTIDFGNIDLSGLLSLDSNPEINKLYGNHFAAGQEYIIPISERNSVYDINDASISSTWETADLSGIVPSNTTKVCGFLRVQPADPVAVLETRPFGISETNGVRLGQTVVDVDTGGYAEILAPEGKFEYREANSSLEIAHLWFVLWGYKVNG